MYLSRRLRRIARVLCTICVVFWTCGGPAIAADVTWDGDTNSDWGTGTNWVGDPADAAVGGSGFDATFNSLGNGNTSIDLGGTQTINHLFFNNAGTASYTIGVLGTDTLVFDNGGGIDTNAALDADQTIAADLLLGNSGANTFRIDTESTTNRVIITGDIDTGTGAGTAGVQRLEIGDLGGLSGGKLVQIDGSISNSGGATRLDLFVGGADLELNGIVDTAAGGNTMRTFVRDGATATIGATGALGRGSLELRNGTVNLNTNLQQFDNTLILGDTGNQANTATLSIGVGNTLALNTGITYEERNDAASTAVASINGGSLQITGANRTIVVHDNEDVAANSPELTITSNIVNDGVQDRDLTIRGPNGEQGGTIRFSGANTSGAINLQNGRLQLGHATGSLDDDFVNLGAWNNANAPTGSSSTLDLMGNEAHIAGLTLGNVNTNLIPGANGHTMLVEDTVGGGTLTLNNITYNDGTAGKENGAATISANLHIDANRTWTINDNATIASTSPELTVSGNITDDISNNRDITTQGDGTLLISGNNTHDRTVLQNQRVILGSGDVFGTGDGAGVPGPDTAGAGGIGDGRVFVQHFNGTNAAIYDGPVTLDINGQDVVLNENLVVGGGSTANVANLGSHSVIDSVGTGRLIFSGLNGNGDNNNINNNVGNVGFENRTAIISADIRMENSGMTITANDAFDAIDIDISGSITDETGGTRTLVKNGAGALRLSSASNNFGELSVQRGRLIITDVGAVGTNRITLGNNNTDGILEYTGTGGTINEEFRVGDNNAAAGRNGGGTITNIGSGTLNLVSPTAIFNQARTAVTEARTLTLDGTSDIVISGNILDNNTGGGGTVGLTKNGANTVTVNGTAHTYTGATSVNAGQLILNGTLESAITVAAGANLGGEGSTSQTLVFQGTTHTLDIDATTAAALGSTGTGSTDVSALNVGGFTVNVNGSGAGAVDVLTYGSGGFTGALDRFVVGTAPAASLRTGGSGVFADSGTAITFDLGFEDKIWEGTDGTNPTFWDINTTSNWSGGSDALFFDGDSVTMNDSASDFNPTLQSSVSVGNVTINATNSANDYVLDDNGGGETITISGTFTIANGDATTTNDGNDVVINAAIAGSGSVFIGDGNDGVQDASQNSVQFTAANSYTGGTIIDEGRVSITDSSSLGTGTITMQDGEAGSAGTNRDTVLDLDMATGFTLANDFNISGINGGKTIRLNNTGANTGTLSGNILNAESLNNFRLETEADDTLTVSGQISGGGFVTTKGPAGSGVTFTNGSNNYTGPLVVASDVSVASIGNTGAPSHTGAGNRIILGIQGGNGTTLAGNRRDGNLIYTGAGESTDKRIQVGNHWFTTNNNAVRAGAISNNGTGGLTFTNPTFSFQESRIAGNIGPRTLTLGGTFTGDNEIQGTITDNNATDGFVDETVGVTVDTGGTWILSAANTYSGDTNVNGGTLQVGNGGTTGSLGSGVNLAGGANDTIVNVNDTGTLALNRTDGVTQTGDLNFFGGVAGNTNFHAMDGVNEINGGTSNIDITGTSTWTADAGSELNINNNAGGTGIGFGTTVQLNLDGAGNGSIDRTIALGSANGTVTKNGTGTWTLSGAYTEGQGWSTGGLVVNDGTLATGATNVIPWGAGKGDVTVSSPGTLDLTGGGVNINGLSGNGTVDNTGAMTQNLNIGNNNASATFTGLIQNTGTTINVNKVGSGTQTLTGNNTYSGTTMVNGGTLVVDGDQSGATGDVTVSAGATLAGVGTIGGDTTISGTHAPGTSPGIQTFDDGASGTDLTYTAGADIDWELDSSTVAGRGTNYDGIDLGGGTLDFSGSTSLDLLFDGGSVLWTDSLWTTNQIWNIYSGAGTVSNFGNLTFTTSLDSGSNAFGTGFTSNGMFSLENVGGNINLLYTVTPVPEPSALALVGLGLMGCASRRRRKSSK